MILGLSKFLGPLSAICAGLMNPKHAHNSLQFLPRLRSFHRSWWTTEIYSCLDFAGFGISILTSVTQTQLTPSQYWCQAFNFQIVDRHLIIVFVMKNRFGVRCSATSLVFFLPSVILMKVITFILLYNSHDINILWNWIS